MSKPLKVAGACLNQTPIDWSNNLQNIKSAIDQARTESVDILCLPELCITGYGCEDLFLTEWLPEKAAEKLQEIIDWTDGIAVCAGLPTKYEGKTYNTTCYIANREIKGFYAKQMLANDGVHYEPRWFSRWEAKKVVDFHFNGSTYPFGHVLIHHDGVRIGFEICEDAWANDRSSMKYDEKIDIILNPSASHFSFHKATLREEIVKKGSAAVEGVYVYVNQLGNEAGRTIYDGDILIANKGDLVARNKRFSFEDFNLLAAEIDLSTPVEEKLAAEEINKNEEFTKAASLALFDYLRKSKSNGYVLSLSGGADSSTIATLVAEMVSRGVEELGKESFEKKLGFALNGNTEKEYVGQILTVAYQGTRNSSEDTFNSAKGLAESIGATFHSWTIDDQVDSYRETIERVIERPLTWEKDDIALQNIQARSRSPIIWMLANLNNALLMATSNRSEGSVGYATMDGDTSGSISPIAGVSKHFILQWLQYAEKELGYEGLKVVNQLEPTAELRPEEQLQTDEADLMPYEVLHKIEQAAILNGKSPKQVLAELEKEYDPKDAKAWIKKFYQLWTRNQWKRERYAPSFHFDDFNVDPRSWYRFPILSGGFKEELSNL